MLRPILVSLLFAFPALAQDQNQDQAQDQDQPAQPPVPQPPVPQPPPPGIEPPQPAANQPGEPQEPGAGEDLAQADFPAPDPNTPTELSIESASLLDLAELYHALTGKIVMVSDEAAGSEIKITVPGRLTYAQAAVLIEKKLALEGFALIQDPDLPRLMKLVVAASQVKQQELDLEDDPEDLQALDGPADRVITYVMALEFLKPTEALQAFSSVVGQFGAAGTVAAVPNAGSVIITAQIPLVRTLVKLKERIDVPAARVGTAFVEVTYADVEELSEKLNEIFNTQQQQQQTARVQRTGQQQPAQPPIPPTANNATPAAAATPSEAASGGGAGEETPITILPQPRTSRIFLMGRPVDIVFVEGLIKDFDTPSSKRNFLRRKLAYLPVIEFLDVAATAIERTLETGGAGGVGGTTTSSRRSTAGRGTFGTNQLNQRTNQTTAGGVGGTGGAAGSRAQIQQQEFNTAPDSVLVGKTLLVADNISNSIVVNGPPHHIEIVQELVEELDQPSEQVAITAVFARYDLTKGQSFGVDLVNLLDNVTDDARAGFSFRNNTPGVVEPDLLDDFANAIASSGGAASSAGLSAYGFFGDNFGVFVNALEANSRFTAISRPTVFTTNNGIARISSGSRIAVPTSTFQGGTATGQSTNIEFRDIVLELEVQPLVNSSEEVTLQISLVRDALGQNREILGVGEVPDIDTEEVATTVTVPNRSTIVLGGLITQEDSRNKTGLPILSGIPGIGWLFGSGDRSSTREELVILIHPSILLSERGGYNGAKQSVTTAPGTQPITIQQYQDEYDRVNNVSQQARASVEGASGQLLPARGSFRSGFREENRHTPNVGRAVPVQGTGEEPEAAPRRGVVTSPTQQILRNRRSR